MDGYAIRRGDLIGPGPWTLRVDGLLAAGTKASERPVCEPGGALEVATGAQIFGALDAVIPHETVQRDGETVTIFQCPPRNANIRARGQDAKSGTDLLPAGHVLGARDIALLAGLARAEVTVRQTVRVACLSTGSELVEVGTKLGRGQMHDSNRPMLKAALDKSWITYLDLGVIRDDPKTLEKALPLAASAADVIIVTGGASGGGQTAVSDAMEALGGEIIARNIAMKPGKPVMVARLKGALCICLPGNAVSAAIALEVLGWDLLRARAGITDLAPQPCKGVAGFKMAGKPGRAEFPLVAVTGSSPDGTPILSFTPGATPANLRRLSEADGFAHIDADHADIEKGSSITWTRF
jgi:molybdopterin molybdotransferase